MQSRKVIDLESDITYYGNSKLIATNHITTTIPVSVQTIIVVLVLSEEDRHHDSIQHLAQL